MEIAKNALCDGFTGADLAALVRDASVMALSEIITTGKNETDIVTVSVTAKHFERALHNLRPSVSEKVSDTISAPFPDLLMVVYQKWRGRINQQITFDRSAKNRLHNSHIEKLLSME